MYRHAAPFAISLLFLPLAALGAWFGGLWMLAAPLYTFAIIPSLDHLMKLNEEYLPADTDVSHLFWHRVLLWAWVPVQFLMIFGLVWIAANTDRLAIWEILTMAVIIGLATGGIGITYAHELIHQKPLVERRLGELLMCSTLYAHWCTEHVYGHHINVATPEDPATAREGENIYQFLPRVLKQTAVSAWNIQQDMLQRRGLSVGSFQNAFWRYAAITVLILLMSFMLGGWVGLLVLLVQAGVAVLLPVSYTHLTLPTILLV